MTTIIEYSTEYQEGIDAMMAGIAKEFNEPINSPQSIKLYDAYKLPDQKYWVALHGEKVIGTVGVILLSGHNSTLKRMMTDKDYRGKETQLATHLLNTAIDWAKKQGCKRMYLGTMGQFKAAQNFYRKSGFTEIPVSQMPADDKINPIDKLFFTKEI